jgi:hypothetical protein
MLCGDRNIGINNISYGFSPENGVNGNLQFLGKEPNTSPLKDIQWTDKMHQKAGNVTLTDGSVSQISTAKLKEACKNSNDTTITPGANTILFP